jgi:2-phosphosulfolactate phosphatase
MIHVHMLPDLMDTPLSNSDMVVVIDILRASTSMATALQNGCAGIRACATPTEAFEWKARGPAGKVLLGGERKGVRIDGFDLGNSPAEYGADVVRGRQVVFTTTNGTRALLRSVQAGRVLVGCFLNRSAVLTQLQNHHGHIHLVCAGTDGSITGEDVLFAGSIVAALNQHEAQRNDSAEIALRCWNDVVQISDSKGIVNSSNDGNLSDVIEAWFHTTHGGRNLLELGFDEDLKRCSRLDTLSAVPTFDHSSGVLR